MKLDDLVQRIIDEGPEAVEDAKEALALRKRVPPAGLPNQIAEMGDDAANIALSKLIYQRQLNKYKNHDNTTKKKLAIIHY